MLLELSEFALYQIHRELEALFDSDTVAPSEGRGDAMPEVQLVPLLASVQDDDRMREIMSTWHPDTVYHAAAYKHVPMVEYNPAEGVMNNVFGTLTVAWAAQHSGVARFVLISTDKAVRPTNLMGASKRVAEMILQALAADDIDDVTAYAYARVGYHRSLDMLRRNGWKGHGPVPWEHEPNRGFLRALWALSVAAGRIGEAEEQEGERKATQGRAPRGRGSGRRRRRCSARRRGPRRGRASPAPR